MNNDAIAADLSDICLPFSDRVKPTNQSFFLSHLELLIFGASGAKEAGDELRFRYFLLELDWIY